MVIFRQRFSRGGTFQFPDKPGVVISSQFAEPLNDKVLVPVVLFLRAWGPALGWLVGQHLTMKSFLKSPSKHLNAHVYNRPKTPTYPDLH